MSTVNAPTTTNGTDVVLGEKVVCWGGAPYIAGQAYTQSPTQPSELTNSGAVYSATDDTWTAMSTTNAPSPRSGMVALAMRGKMFIWGGTDGTTNSLGEQNYFHDGGIFDPETNTWTSISKEGSPPTYNGWSGLWAEEQGLAYVWAFIWAPGDRPTTRLPIDGSRSM
jgi:N-acetylneuraminic acid mutarotase